MITWANAVVLPAAIAIAARAMAATPTSGTILRLAVIDAPTSVPAAAATKVSAA